MYKGSETCGAHQSLRLAATCDVGKAACEGGRERESRERVEHALAGAVEAKCRCMCVCVVNLQASSLALLG